MVGGRPTAPGEYDFVVRFGECTAVLIDKKTLLSSAHCIALHPNAVDVAGTSHRIDHCEIDPEYSENPPTHDVAFCRLADSVTVVVASELYLGPLQVDDPVALVGYGQTDPFTRSVPTSRVAETRTTSGPPDLLAGTATVTACRGDSGGGVFTVTANGGLAGIIHGPSGAICASPARVAWLSESGRWLREKGVVGEATGPSRFALIGLSSVAVALALILVRWHWLRKRPTGAD